MIEVTTLNETLKNSEVEVTILGGTFDYADKQERLVEVERELEQPDVWNDAERAQALGKERSLLEGVVNTIDTMDSGLIDARDLLDLAVEENDQDTLDEVQSELDALTMGLEKLEFRRMFSGEMDARLLHMLKFNPDQVEQKLRIGLTCFCECIPNGLKAEASQ